MHQQFLPHLSPEKLRSARLTLAESAIKIYFFSLSLVHLDGHDEAGEGERVREGAEAI